MLSQRFPQRRDERWLVRVCPRSGKLVFVMYAAKSLFSPCNLSPQKTHKQFLMPPPTFNSSLALLALKHDQRQPAHTNSSSAHPAVKDKKGCTWYYSSSVRSSIILFSCTYCCMITNLQGRKPRDPVRAQNEEGWG